MVPILPREMLWHDLQTMDEFFELEPVCEDLYAVFMRVKEEPFNIQTNAVKIFNEVFYQVTRMFFERPLPSDLDRYIADIKANLGWNYGAALVLSMSQWLINNITPGEMILNKFFRNAIAHGHWSLKLWESFERRFALLGKEPRKVTYSFKPQPYAAIHFKELYINWQIITRDYNLSCIEYVLKLWVGFEDRKLIGILLYDNVRRNFSYSRRSDKEQITTLIDRLVDESKPQHDVVGHIENVSFSLDEEKIELEELRNENVKQESRIAELETEIEKLKSFKSENHKQHHSQERSFTLPLIVDYCKKRVEWTEAMYIVSMLNRLLLGEAKKEEIEMINSIETEFINRKYGIIFPNAQVTMQQPTINAPLNDIHDNNNVNMGGE